MKELTALNLEIRAKRSLINANEISPELLNEAISDALEASTGRAVAYYVKEDLAYIRLKIRLKIGLSEEDLLLYEEAKKAIKEAPLLFEDEAVSNKFYKVKNRDDFF